MVKAKLTGARPFITLCIDGGPASSTFAYFSNTVVLFLCVTIALLSSVYYGNAISRKYAPKLLLSFAINTCPFFQITAGLVVAFLSSTYQV